MSRESHPTKQAPRKPLSAPLAASDPRVGPSGGSEGLSGPHSGAQRFTDEIEAAARKLSSGMLIVRADLDMPLAKLLRESAALHEPGCPGRRPDGTNCGAAHGCDWCGDEDWPCNDTRNALAVARAILRTQDTP